MARRCQFDMCTYIACFVCTMFNATLVLLLIRPPIGVKWIDVRVAENIPIGNVSNTRLEIFTKSIETGDNSTNNSGKFLNVSAFKDDNRLVRLRAFHKFLAVARKGYKEAERFKTEMKFEAGLHSFACNLLCLFIDA